MTASKLNSILLAAVLGLLIWGLRTVVQNDKSIETTQTALAAHSRILDSHQRVLERWDEEKIQMLSQGTPIDTRLFASIAALEVRVSKIEALAGQLALIQKDLDWIKTKLQRDNP